MEVGVPTFHVSLQGFSNMASDRLANQMPGLKIYVN